MVAVAVWVGVGVGVAVMVAVAVEVAIAVGVAAGPTRTKYLCVISLLLDTAAIGIKSPGLRDAHALGMVTRRLKWPLASAEKSARCIPQSSQELIIGIPNR